MRRIGRDDDDVARARLPLLVARREGALPLLQDEDLLVGVPVQSGSAAGRGVDE
jgi:hypothetical protein